MCKLWFYSYIELRSNSVFIAKLLIFCFSWVFKARLDWVKSLDPSRSEVLSVWMLATGKEWRLHSRKDLNNVSKWSQFLDMVTLSSALFKHKGHWHLLGTWWKPCFGLEWEWKLVFSLFLPTQTQQPWVWEPDITQSVSLKCIIARWLSEACCGTCDTIMRVSSLEMENKILLLLLVYFCELPPGSDSLRRCHWLGLCDRALNCASIFMLGEALQRQVVLRVGLIQFTECCR